LCAIRKTDNYYQKNFKKVLTKGFVFGILTKLSLRQALRQRQDSEKLNIKRIERRKTFEKGVDKRDEVW